MDEEKEELKKDQDRKINIEAERRQRVDELKPKKILDTFVESKIDEKLAAAASLERDDCEMQSGARGTGAPTSSAVVQALAKPKNGLSRGASPGKGKGKGRGGVGGSSTNSSQRGRGGGDRGNYLATNIKKEQTDKWQWLPRTHLKQWAKVVESH